MKKNFMYKFLISILFIFFLNGSVFAKTPVFVSLSPALTEIICALGADNMLKGVSTACTYPNCVKNKEKIGDTFFIDEEKILKIKPDYILALDSSEFALNKYKKYGITPLCFKYPDIDSVYSNIITLGKLTGKNKEANYLVSDIKRKISLAKTKNPKRILYLVQTQPMITIGKKSFITDIILKSGNISVTSKLNYFYPTISEECALKMKPDVVVLSFASDTKRIKKLFPKSKIVILSKDMNDVITRPSPRIYKSVEFFSGL